MKIFENKKVFLTGGTSGIGKETALKLMENGAQVCLMGRSRKKIDLFQMEAQELGYSGKITAIQHDLTDTESLQELLNSTWQKYGGFDVLINNAGIGFSSVIGARLPEVEYLIASNLTSYIFLSGYFARRMSEEGISGDIINVGSMSASGREEGSSGYVATKSGIQGFTESLRKEVNSLDIRVTLIEPGSVATEMQELSPEEENQRVQNMEMLQVEDLASIIIYVLNQPRRVNFPSLEVKPLRQNI